VSRLLANLLTIFGEHDLELLEINPLILTADGLVAADAKVTVDDDALFRQEETLALVARAPLAELEARAREHGLNFVDLEGEVCVMGNGAGLCLSLLDAMAAHGSSAANFLDTGGGASTSKAYEGMRILQDRSADLNVRARLVMLSLAITRAKEAADGIVQSHRERPDGVPTFAVVHGTGSEEGRRILEEAGIHVAADIRTAVELAAKAERSA
jgi:succinyl-CoA synthetase beta subunit